MATPKRESKEELERQLADTIEAKGAVLGREAQLKGKLRALATEMRRSKRQSLGALVEELGAGAGDLDALITLMIAAARTPTASALFQEALLAMRQAMIEVHEEGARSATNSPATEAGHGWTQKEVG